MSVALRVPSRDLAARWVVVAIVLALSVAPAGCRREKSRPLQVDDNVLRVHNDTPDEWRDVEIWVNDHYRVTRASIAAGERFAVRLDAFVEAYGRRFDWRRQPVFGIEVTGKRAQGPDVKIDWGKGRRR